LTESKFTATTTDMKSFKCLSQTTSDLFGFKKWVVK